SQANIFSCVNLSRRLHDSDRICNEYDTLRIVDVTCIWIRHCSASNPYSSSVDVLLNGWSFNDSWPCIIDCKVQSNNSPLNYCLICWVSQCLMRARKLSISHLDYDLLRSLIEHTDRIEMRTL